MKHLAQIQLEFLKSARKWNDLTLEEQEGYLKRHPKSKRRITARPSGGDYESPETNELQQVPHKTKKAKFPTDQIAASMKQFNPGGYRSSDYGNEDVDIRQNGKMTSVSTEFRDLGRWHSRPYEEDDDQPNWDPESYKKYSQMFKDWANRQSWFDPKTMKTTVEPGEKAWVEFSIEQRDIKKAKLQERYFKLILKNTLAKKNNQQSPVDQEKLEQLRDKVRKSVGSWYLTGENFLKQKRDGTWKLDKQKVQNELNRY